MPRSWRTVMWLALLAPCCGYAAPAEHEHAASEFEVFVAAEGLTGSSVRHRLDDNSWFNADVILGLTRDKFRAFGEYFVTSDEHDLERLQFGYEFVPDTVLWFGRFHQPASAWNTEHHHGRYLQTAITRPGIENWEDEQGLIPQHITGALVESRRPLGSEAGIQFSGGFGAAPALTDHGYSPIDLVNNNPGKHGAAVMARIAYLPEYAGTSSGGVLWSHDHIFLRKPAALLALRSNDAVVGVYGAYADWSTHGWRFIDATYYVDVELNGPVRNENFISGYLQIERELTSRLTTFGRIEDSARMQKSRYVALFDDHSGDIDITLRRLAVGLRWDYQRRQAVSGEIARVVSLNQHVHEFRLQWSAAIP